ncbi:unnamed protein product [Bursaphelenchus xylophilus]|nr:unnamed protein product [Bursaphelenchus xylophilus]CAG9129702.1 unnamed protein product [Bursaphelenchus xylophilus]
MNTFLSILLLFFIAVPLGAPRYYGGLSMDDLILSDISPTRAPSPTRATRPPSPINIFTPPPYDRLPPAYPPGPPPPYSRYPPSGPPPPYDNGPVPPPHDPPPYSPSRYPSPPHIFDKMRGFLYTLVAFFVVIVSAVPQSDDDLSMEDLELRGNKYTTTYYPVPDHIRWHPNRPSPLPIYEFPEHLPFQAPGRGFVPPMNPPQAVIPPRRSPPPPLQGPLNPQLLPPPFIPPPNSPPPRRDGSPPPNPQPPRPVSPNRNRFWFPP